MGSNLFYSCISKHAVKFDLKCPPQMCIQTVPDFEFV